MGSINISLKKEAYDFLKSRKTKDLSFSDVVLGFRSEKGDVSKFFGILNKVNWKERADRMKQFRSEFETRLK